jgi:hypothetical protein
MVNLSEQICAIFYIAIYYEDLGVWIVLKRINDEDIKRFNK